MTLNSTNIPVFGPLGPLGPKDTYPTHEAIYGKGGLIQVSSIEERDAIPMERRIVGLQVIVNNEESLGYEDPTVYVLSDGIRNSDWRVINKSNYSTSYGVQVLFSQTQPISREGGAKLSNGDLWVSLNTYILYVYLLSEQRWVQLTGFTNETTPIPVPDPNPAPEEPEEPPVDGGNTTPVSPIFPGVRPKYPENILPVSTPAWNNGDTTLTATGCILISTDNVTYNQGPLSIANDDILWTRWSLDNACAGAADDTVITGRITNGSQYEDGSLRLSKVPNNFSFADQIDQLLSSVSTSNQIKLRGLNANTKIWAPSGTGTSRQISINGGAWTNLPSSFGSALEVPFIANNPTIQVRHTNSGSISTTSTLTIRVGDADTSTRYVSYTWRTTTVSSGPSIAQPTILTPVNNGIDIAIPTTVTSSAYSAANGAGTHDNSDWQVNSGELTLFTTNPIQSVNYINTDLGTTSWYEIAVDYGGYQDYRFTTEFYNRVYPSKFTGVPLTFYSPNPGSNYEEEAIRVVNSTFTVRQYAYSYKLDRTVAVGYSGDLGRIAYLSSLGWQLANVDNENNLRKEFTHVIWNAKNQKFIALRKLEVITTKLEPIYGSGDAYSEVIGYEEVPTTVDHALVYNSSDGITWTEVSTIPASVYYQVPLLDYGDFVYIPLFDGPYISANGSTFTLESLPPFANYFSNRLGGPYKVRDNWVDYLRTTGIYTSSNFNTWSVINGTEYNADLLNDLGILAQHRSHHDALFFWIGDDIYYTLDGVNFELAIDSLYITSGDSFAIYANQGYYYLFKYANRENNFSRAYRAPRTMIQVAISDSTYLGFFTEGKRVKVNGMSDYTYGWIHAVDGTSMTIRGAYGDWSNVTGHTISLDSGDGGAGLIVDLADSTTNKTSYTIPAELMSTNLDYYARVRYGDGSIKSSWSPWSKFTT